MADCKILFYCYCALFLENIPRYWSFSHPIQYKSIHTIHEYTDTVEPLYNEDLGTMKNYLVISGFLLYQGKRTKKYTELGPAKLPCYNRVLLYPTSL